MIARSPTRVAKMKLKALWREYRSRDRVNNTLDFEDWLVTIVQIEVSHEKLKKYL